MELRPRQVTAKGAPEIFVGDVWIDAVPAGDPPSRTRVALVRFAPGARNAWHAHANGQTLHIVDGLGLVQQRGGEIAVVRAGDTFWTPPLEWHWHGATPDHFMSHLSITEALAEGQQGPETDWGEHVADYPTTWP
jgi:quercetin dioxygenase-like cupin family protein